MKASEDRPTAEDLELAILGEDPVFSAQDVAAETGVTLDEARRLWRALGFPDRGLQERGDLSGFNWSNRPSVLVELGFLSNPTEDRLLATAAYRRRAARGLCEGALRFLGRSTAACG